MTRATERYLVYEINGEFETSNEVVFSNYAAAKNYFEQIIGKFFLAGFSDCSYNDDNGAKDIREYFSIYPNFYFESACGEKINSLPENADDFKNNCNSYVTFGDYTIWNVVMKKIKEEL